jgi:PAS domain-containing protein
VAADPSTTMAADSAAKFSRGWRYVALIGCVGFPPSFALYHCVVPLGAWVAAAPELLVSAIGAGATTLLAMLAAAIGITRRMQVDNRRMRVAINNMSQGLCMFDRNERLVVRNRRYMELYQLSDEVVTPGRTLASLLEYRISTGSISRDPDEYRQGLVAAMAQGKTTTAEVKSTTGRVVSIINRPMAAGWRPTRTLPNGATPSANAPRCRSSRNAARSSSGRSPRFASASRTTCAR